MKNKINSDKVNKYNEYNIILAYLNNAIYMAEPNSKIREFLLEEEKKFEEKFKKLFNI